MSWRRGVRYVCLGVLAFGTLLGCGQSTGLFNPSFVNFAVGGVFPLVPGEENRFVLVTVVNSTSGSPLPQSIRWVVTAEQQVETAGDDDVVTVAIEPRTVRLQTTPEQLANQVGVLFECPVERVGLGVNIDFPASEPGLFVGAVTGGAEGFGVPGNVNPLDVAAGNFQCGDTVIFQASYLAGTVGNVTVGSFVLDASGQAAQVRGPDTFTQVRTVVDEFRATGP